MLVAVASLKGAPGVTTLCVGMAALWPGAPAVVVECDPDGGDLVSRFGHHPAPGLATLAAAVRHGSTGDGRGSSNRPDLRTGALAPHLQQLSLGVHAVLAPPGEAAVSAAIVAEHAGAVLLPPAGGAVVADVGRVARPGPGLLIAAGADHVLLVARPTVEDLRLVAWRLDALRGAVSGQLWLVLAGDGPIAAGEAARDTGVPVIGAVPRDRWGAGVLSGRITATGWRRLRLPRAARTIAAGLVGAAPNPDRSTDAGSRPRTANDPRTVPNAAGDGWRRIEASR